MGLGSSLKKIGGGIIGAISNPMMASAIIGTGSDYLASKEQAKENSRNRTHQDEMNVANYQMQKEFAQHGIRWKAEDAIAAGLHPLAALGATGASASPSYQMGDTGPSPKAEFYSRMGQNLSRAASVTQTHAERLITQEGVKRAILENQLLEWQVADVRKKVLGPAMPASNVVETPLSRVAAEVDRNWQEVGSYPSVAYMQSPTGLVPVMPPNLAEALESDQTNQVQWATRYKGGPNVAPLERPSAKKLPPGAAGWMWSHKLQEWQPKTHRELEKSGRKNAENKWFKKIVKNRDIWNYMRKTWR